MRLSLSLTAAEAPGRGCVCLLGGADKERHEHGESQEDELGGLESGGHGCLAWLEWLRLMKMRGRNVGRVFL